MEIRPLEPSDKEDSYAIIKVILEHLDVPLINQFGWEEAKEILKTAMDKPYYRYGCQNGYGVFVEGELVSVAYAYPGVMDPMIEAPLETTMIEMGYSSDQIPSRYAFVEALMDEFYLDSIATKKGYEKNGYATALIHYLEKQAQAQGYAKLSLNVDFDNQKARQLYEQLGFTVRSEVMIGGQAHYHLVKEV